MHKPKGCATRCPKASDPHDFPALVDKPVPGVAVMVEDTRTNIISLGHVTHAIAPGPPCSRTHRCRSWCRASWPAQTPWRPMRRSTSEPVAPVSQARPALPPGCPIRIQPEATAILHGLARRTAPHPQAPATRSRASRWPAGRRTDLYGAMSALALIASAPPPTPDVGGTPGECLNLTQAV